MIEQYELLLVEGSDVYFEFINDLLEKSRIYLAPPGGGSLPQEFHVSRYRAIADAISELEDTSRQYDAVLVSNRSRVRAERDALSTLIRFAGMAPVLLLTTLGDNDNDIRQCLEAGMVAHISIPSLRYQGTEFFVHSVLDAIALRRGEFAKEESRVEAAEKGARRSLRIGQAIAIVVWAGVVFVGNPSFQNQTFIVDIFADGALENFLKGVGAILSVNLRPLRTIIQRGRAFTTKVFARLGHIKMNRRRRQ